REMRRYAETHSDGWYIRSAQHGLFAPEAVVSPYELTLRKVTVGARMDWAATVAQKVLRLTPQGASLLVLVGARYREVLEPILAERNIRIEVPMRGLPIGKQLQWLKRANHV